MVNGFQYKKQGHHTLLADRGLHESKHFCKYQLLNQEKIGLTSRSPLSRRDNAINGRIIQEDYQFVGITDPWNDGSFVHGMSIISDPSISTLFKKGSKVATFCHDFLLTIIFILEKIYIRWSKSPLNKVPPFLILMAYRHGTCSSGQFCK